MSVVFPSNLFATKQEREQARNGSNPELTKTYIEHLEEIAKEAFELAIWDYSELDEIDWTRLRDALGKVYNIHE